MNKLAVDALDSTSELKHLHQQTEVQDKREALQEQVDCLKAKLQEGPRPEQVDLLNEKMHEEDTTLMFNSTEAQKVPGTEASIQFPPQKDTTFLETVCDENKIELITDHSKNSLDTALVQGFGGQPHDKAATFSGSTPAYGMNDVVCIDEGKPCPQQETDPKEEYPPTEKAEDIEKCSLTNELPANSSTKSVKWKAKRTLADLAENTSELQKSEVSEKSPIFSGGSSKQTSWSELDGAYVEPVWPAGVKPWPPLKVTAPEVHVPRASRFVGVYPQPGSTEWVSQFVYGPKDSKFKFLGSHATEEEAAKAYDAFQRQLYGDQACCNFNEDGTENLDFVLPKRFCLDWDSEQWVAVHKQERCFPPLHYRKSARFRGVSARGRYWIAELDRRVLGYYPTDVEAACAYDKALFFLSDELPAEEQFNFPQNIPHYIGLKQAIDACSCTPPLIDMASNEMTESEKYSYSLVKASNTHTMFSPTDSFLNQFLGGEKKASMKSFGYHTTLFSYFPSPTKILASSQSAQSTDQVQSTRGIPIPENAKSHLIPSNQLAAPSLAFMCTACGRELSKGRHVERFLHPLLGIPVCKRCWDKYHLGEFSIDEEGFEVYCRWCGDGGVIFSCDSCCRAFCKKCIQRNFGSREVSRIEALMKWVCYVCDQDAINALKRAIWGIPGVGRSAPSNTLDSSPRLALTPDARNVVMEDISNGRERVPIPCVNDYGTEIVPMEFVYVTEPAPGERVSLTNNPDFLVCCSCKGGCEDPNHCECLKLMNNNFAYNKERQLIGGVLAVYECNWRCSCHVDLCRNRNVGKGNQLRLEVFKCKEEGKGWGVRCRDKIPAGTYVSNYLGEIITELDAERRGVLCGDEYLFNLDMWANDVARQKLDDLGLKESFEQVSPVFSIHSTLQKFGSGAQFSKANREVVSKKIRTRYQDPLMQDELKHGPSCASQTESPCDFLNCSPPRSRTSPSCDDLPRTPVHSPVSSLWSARMTPDPGFLQHEAALRKKYHHQNESSSEDTQTETQLSYDSTELDCIDNSTALNEQSQGRRDKLQQLQSPDLQCAIRAHTSGIQSQSPAPIGNAANPQDSATQETERSEVQMGPQIHQVQEMVDKIIEEVSRDSGLCVDAKWFGNVGRFINHSCDPNLCKQTVFVETHDVRMPRLAFFAVCDIPALEELTYDYGYKTGSVEGKQMVCRCGSQLCRGRMY